VEEKEDMGGLGVWISGTVPVQHVQGPAFCPHSLLDLQWLSHHILSLQQTHILNYKNFHFPVCPLHPFPYINTAQKSGPHF
jgi:hypothetical protein